MLDLDSIVRIILGIQQILMVYIQIEKALKPNKKSVKIHIF